MISLSPGDDNQCMQRVLDVGLLKYVLSRKVLTDTSAESAK